MADANLSEMYDYLMRARRDLWTALRAAPDAALSRQLLNGDRFHCIKDLVFHTPSVEDAWLHFDILQTEPVMKRTPGLEETKGGPVFADVPLSALLAYWQAVERETLAYIGDLTIEELKRAVKTDDSPHDYFTVDGLLWHVMLHEVRHTAQIAMLLRLQDIKPPALDLLFYLPGARP